METNPVVGDKVTILFDPRDPQAVPQCAVVARVSTGGFDYHMDLNGHPNGDTGFRYFRDEGSKWARGHEKRVGLALVRAAKRATAQEKLKREREETDRRRKADQWTVERLREAARVVAKAKLPKELRETAFQFCLMRAAPWGVSLR